jgi:hypothetical protein
MIAQMPSLRAILMRYRIHSRFWAEFCAYVEANVPLGDELQACLDHITSYKAALEEALHDTGNPHAFAPTDYRSPVSYESMWPGDVKGLVESEPLASAGVPSAAR